MKNGVFLLLPVIEVCFHQPMPDSRAMQLLGPHSPEFRGSDPTPQLKRVLEDCRDPLHRILTEVKERLVAWGTTAAVVKEDTDQESTCLHNTPLEGTDQEETCQVDTWEEGTGQEQHHGFTFLWSSSPPGGTRLSGVSSVATAEPRGYTR